MTPPISRPSGSLAVTYGRPLVGTALLAATGALVGGTLGNAALLALQFRAPDGLQPGVIPFVLIVGGAFGALVGGAAAPLMGWTLLRRVPFGRAILGTTIGTVIGAGAGGVLGHPAIGGVAGYAMAAAALFFVYRHHNR